MPTHVAQDGQAPQVARTPRGALHPDDAPLTKLMWFARNQPEPAVAARGWVGLENDAHLWLTGDLLVNELTSASGTGLLDMSARMWSTESLALCGISAERLPHILPTTTTALLSTAAARRVGLPAA